MALAGGGPAVVACILLRFQAPFSHFAIFFWVKTYSFFVPTAPEHVAARGNKNHWCFT